MKEMRMVELGDCSPKERELLLKRSELDVSSVMPQVARIVSDVRRNGDRALSKYTKRFDCVKISTGELRVSGAEFRLAHEQVNSATLKAIRESAAAIRKFHLMQMPKGWNAQLAPGIDVGQLVRPLEKVGVYVPGGLAKYPSSLLMGAVPAKVAGVKHVVVCTPPGKNDRVDAAVLAAAKVAGVDAVFKVGGAHAIAAMAYGTGTVPKVDKIVGPGNIYVAAAKQVVSADVGIDFAAGPSEVLIIADDSAEPRFIAADLISQAEHDTEAAAVLVTNSKKLACRVQELVGEMAEDNPRKDIVMKSLKRFGLMVMVKDLDEAVYFSNAYAPEHLEIMVKNPKKLLTRVKNAGSIFLGAYSPVAAGDLAVGPNHILPTGGAARRHSGLSVLDFVRLPTVQELSKQGLRRVLGTAERLAGVEGLPGHARSIRERLKKG